MNYSIDFERKDKKIITENKFTVSLHKVKYIVTLALLVGSVLSALFVQDLVLNQLAKGVLIFSLLTLIPLTLKTTTKTQYHENY